VGAILIVCTGNICRSPMAWGFLEHLLRQRKIRTVWVESAGTYGWDGNPATPEAILAMKEREIDLSLHRARRLAASMVEQADVVITMATEHREAVSALGPEAASRTFTIRELVRLLDGFPGHGNGSDTAQDRLRRAVAWADALRSSGTDPGGVMEDIADPLGLSLASFQATAWELEGLCRQLVDQFFGPEWTEAPAFDRAMFWGTGVTESGGT
jgi:protein-tyrosine-phosphatase